MTDPKSPSEQSETPDDVATLLSWANLHGAKYRDFSASRAQARDEARKRVEEIQAAEELRRQEEAERKAQEDAQIAARLAAEAAEAARQAEADRLAEIAKQAEAEHQAVLAAQEAQRQAAQQRTWAPSLNPVQPAQGQPIQPQPIQPQPIHPQAVASQPLQLQPIQPQPVQSQPVSSQQFPSQPAHAQPAQAPPPVQQFIPPAPPLASPPAPVQNQPYSSATYLNQGYAHPGPAYGNSGYPPATDTFPEYAPGNFAAGYPAAQQDPYGSSSWQPDPRESSYQQPAWLATEHVNFPNPPASAAPEYTPQSPQSHYPPQQQPQYQPQYPVQQPQQYAPQQPTRQPGQPQMQYPQFPDAGANLAPPRQPNPAPNMMSNQNYDPMPGGLAPTPVDDTLLGSRDRITNRWYALKTVFDPNAAPAEPVPMAPPVRPPALAVFSLAGGVGKTSLVASLGRALSSRGEKILLVDTASFGLLPFFFGARDQRPGMLRTFNPPGVSTDAPIQLITLDPESQTAESAGPEWLMQEVGRYARGSSRIVMDLPTASGAITRRALKLAPVVLVPVVPDMNSVVSVGAIEAFFRHNTGNANPPGKQNLPFYVLNQFDYSLPLHLDVREILREQIGDRLLPFALRRSAAVSEALAEGMTVMDYAPTAVVAEDYASLAGWVRSLSAPATVGYRGVRWSER